MAHVRQKFGGRPFGFQRGLPGGVGFILQVLALNGIPDGGFENVSVYVPFDQVVLGAQLHCLNGKGLDV